jgi:hypothetical protein
MRGRGKKGQYVNDTVTITYFRDNMGQPCHAYRMVPERDPVEVNLYGEGLCMLPALSEGYRRPFVLPDLRFCANNKNPGSATFVPDLDVQWSAGEEVETEVTDDVDALADVDGLLEDFEGPWAMDGTDYNNYSNPGNWGSADTMYPFPI